MKRTKSALLASAVSMLLCVAMLVGTTFAWFTDSASTGVNKIQAGNLDIQLLGENDVDLEGKALKWAAHDGRDEILWEPGATYKTQPFYIKNNGSLNLKFKFVVSGIQGDAKLLEVIDFTAMTNANQFKFNTEGVSISTSGAFDLLEGYELDTLFYGVKHFDEYVLEPGQVAGPIVLEGHMQETAGNEYQGLSIDNISITVYAAQATGEEDSFNGVYDENALYEVDEVVTNEEALKSALNGEAESVLVTENIALSTPLSINRNVTIIGSGKATISKEPVHIGTNANVTFKNMSFAAPVNANGNASSLYASNYGGKLVFEGCTFANPQWESIQVTPLDGAEIIVNNCTFIIDGKGVYAHGTKTERMLHIEAEDNTTGAYKATITNNKFIGADKVRNTVIDVDDVSAFENVTCGGNTFFNHDNTTVTTMSDDMIYVNIYGYYDSEHVAKNTFVQFTQTPAAPLQY